MSKGNLLAGLGSVMGRDMALDLGTANTVVYVRGEGIVLNGRPRRWLRLPAEADCDRDASVVGHRIGALGSEDLE